MSNQKRRPEGTPVGGQFAATQRPSADVPPLGYAGRYADPEPAPGLTEDDVDDFTHNGRCMALADALHERTGWPVAVLADTEGRLGWFHAGVRTPEGTLVDVVGEHDQYGWFDKHQPFVDEYGYDLEAEDPAYEYDGDLVEVCDFASYGWKESGFPTSHSPEDLERASALADRILTAREAGTLPRTGYLQAQDAQADVGSTHP